MECNKDEAIRAMDIAKRKVTEHDYCGAKTFAVKAQNLYPQLDRLKQVLMLIDVYISAGNKINGGEEPDWYGVLGVDPLADDGVVKKQYRKLALLLHPDKNKCEGAEGAFKLVLEAWSLLSDKVKRIAFDQKRRMVMVKEVKPRKSRKQKQEPKEPKQPTKKQKQAAKEPKQPGKKQPKQPAKKQEQLTKQQEEPANQQKEPPKKHEQPPKQHEQPPKQHEQPPKQQEQPAYQQEEPPKQHEEPPNQPKHQEEPPNQPKQPAYKQEQPAKHQEQPPKQQEEPAKQQKQPPSNAQKQQPPNQQRQQQSPQKPSQPSSKASRNGRVRSNKPTPKVSTFWTVCNICETQQAYIRVYYLNKNVKCQSCNVSFKATEIEKTQQATERAVVEETEDKDEEAAREIANSGFKAEERARKKLKTDGSCRGK